MVDRMKDAEDITLEALFASDTIPDKGFSARVEKRIRRRLWVRRLALPLAVLIGGLIAVKPLADLLTSFLKLASLLPASVSDNLSALPAGNLPQMSTIMLGAMLTVGVVLVARLLED